MISGRMFTQSPKLLDQVRHTCRRRGYRYRTEQAYTSWTRRYVRFHNTTHPRDLDADDVRAFLNPLATERGVATSTQNQALRLRVKDVRFDRDALMVRDGKGRKDRRTMLPPRLQDPLRRHLRHVKVLHEEDTAEGFGTVDLPDALARKYLNAASEWRWPFVFPSAR